MKNLSQVTIAFTFALASLSLVSVQASNCRTASASGKGSGGEQAETLLGKIKQKLEKDKAAIEQDAQKTLAQIDSELAKAGVTFKISATRKALLEAMVSAVNDSANPNGPQLESVRQPPELRVQTALNSYVVGFSSLNGTQQKNLVDTVLTAGGSHAANNRSVNSVAFVVAEKLVEFGLVKDQTLASHITSALTGLKTRENYAEARGSQVSRLNGLKDLTSPNEARIQIEAAHADLSTELKVTHEIVQRVLEYGQKYNHTNDAANLPLMNAFNRFINSQAFFKGKILTSQFWVEISTVKTQKEAVLALSALEKDLDADPTINFERITELRFKIQQLESLLKLLN